MNNLGARWKGLRSSDGPRASTFGHCICVGGNFFDGTEAEEGVSNRNEADIHADAWELGRTSGSGGRWLGVG